MSKIRMRRLEILLLLVLVCVILSLISASYGIETVYTHLFYLPIILTGMWYYRKAIYVATFLSLVHIMVTYFTVSGAFVGWGILRSVVFVAVACTVGLIGEGRAEAEDERAALIKELERRNKELQELFYVTSHHLRESTRKMFTFSNLLLHSVGDKVDPDSRENLQFVVEGANKMQMLLNDLLQYSRVIMHRESKREEVDLNELIEELSNNELAPLLNATHGHIRVPEPLLPVYGDSRQMRLLILNLIANGLKFHRAGTAPEITIRSSRDGDGYVCVSVEDNGIGISEEYHQRIFELFHRLPSSKDTDGTGVGLAICKKIVEQHGGEIGVASTPGSGSTFWFTMPVKERRG